MSLFCDNENAFAQARAAHAGEGFTARQLVISRTDARPFFVSAVRGRRRTMVEGIRAPGYGRQVRVKFPEEDVADLGAYRTAQILHSNGPVIIANTAKEAAEAVLELLKSLK